MTINMQQFYQVFFEETDELLAQMESLLIGLDLSNPDDEALNAIFRAAHSIKGGSSTFGLTDLSGVTHVLESLLDRIRKHEILLIPEHVDAFLQAKDVLAMLLSRHRYQTAVSEEEVESIQQRLRQLAEATPCRISPSTSNLSTKSVSQERKLYVVFHNVVDSDLSLLKEELALCGKVESFTEGDKHGFTLVTMESPENIKSICAFVIDTDLMSVSESAPNEVQVFDGGHGYGFFEPLAPLVVEEGDGYGFFVKVNKRKDADSSMQPLAGPDNKLAVHDSSTSIRVNIDKVDDLINLVGELVITEAMIESCLSTLDPSVHSILLGRVSQLSRNTRSLQEAVMSIRMMPMDYVFSRFPRMVRDLAVKLDKQVELVTLGASTELDKGLIERITDPLTHIIRNSIDHGIEIPADRVAKGKSPIGKVTLSATHAGGNIVIEVSDDGAGLSRDKIISKAQKQGLVLPATPSDIDIWNLIFEPGFSTAEVVTDVSGRGVGMDVVKRNILAMGGTVEISTAYGFGTTITISVPLTLAILEGMSIRLGNEIYILPLNHVLESVQPASVNINTVGGDGQVVKIRGQFLPVVSLRDYFSVSSEAEDPKRAMLVIVESDGIRCALMVDELVGQQQVVVKNLESNYKRVQGISGATILGDGSVSLIIDVNAIAKQQAG